MFNTEYVIIPVCIPEDPGEYIKVSSIPCPIYVTDDKTGRFIDTMKAEQEYIDKAAEIYRWQGKGKLSFAYGYGTGGGIGDKGEAKKANERLIGKLRGFTRRDLMCGKY